MLLLIDAGNTRVKWALIDGAQPGQLPLGQWTLSGSVGRDDLCAIAEALKGCAIGRVLVSNVAGPAMREAIERMVLRAAGVKPVPLSWFASAPKLAGVTNTYRDPGQLGCDRFATMIGAHALFPGQALIVATCGTATTIDALGADGVFAGGMILPGLGLMASSLAQSTAQLPQVAHQHAAARPFADNTRDAIVSGCIAAQAGAIERAWARHAATPSAAQALCILSGGAAEWIAPHLSMPAKRVDNLVLIGLQAALQFNQSPC